MAITFINGLLILTLLTGVLALAAYLKGKRESEEKGKKEDPGHKAVLAGLSVIFLTWFGYLIYLLDTEYQTSSLSVVRPSAAGHIAGMSGKGGSITKYRYTVAGWVYQGTTDDGAGPGKGKVVRVFYNPDYPGESSLTNDGNLHPNWSLLILPVLLGLLGMVALMPRFKKLGRLRPHDRLLVIAIVFVLGGCAVGFNPYVRVFVTKWTTKLLIGRPMDDSQAALDSKALALLCLQEGQYRQAQDYLGKSCQLFVKSNMPAEAAATLDLLGQTQETLGHIGEAQQSYRTALDVLTRNLQTLSSSSQSQILPETVDDLAVDYQLSGDFDRAINTYVEGLKLERAAFGKTSLRIPQTLISLADLLKSQGQLDRAAADYAEAIDILKTSVSTNDPRITYCLDNVAQIFFQQGKLTGSDNLFRSVVASWYNADPDCLQLGLSLETYSRLLKQLHKDDQAQVALERANHILSRW